MIDVDGLPIEFLELLRTYDRDVRAAGVPLAQALSNRRRCVAEKQMPAC